MSSLKAFPILIFLLCTALSCEDHNSPKSGNIAFAVQSTDGFSGGRTKATVSSLLVSVKHANGSMVYERKQIDLFKFGEEYLSEPLAFEVGNFSLTEFIVLDESGNAIYAAPVEGSELAYLVKNPLPIDFKVTQDETNKVIPEILKVEEQHASRFGYSTFALDIVETFTFTTGVLAYSPSTKNFELTEAHLKITSSGETLFDQDLSAETNDVRIPDDHSVYELTVTKEGYTSYEKSFSGSALKAFTMTPLVITLFIGTLDEGLIAYYPFTGNADDESSNDLHGTVHGAELTSDRHGAPHSAYSFDGMDDYISVPHDEVLNLPGDFTISLWTKVDSDQESHDGINDILRKWTGDAQGYPFAISYLNENADDMHEDKIISVRYDGQICDNTPTTYSPAIENDVFLHIVLIKEGTMLRHYLNNVLIEEVEDTTTCAIANTADMTIGSRGNLVRFFKGTIDDIRIYSRGLGSTEVANLYGQ